MKFSFPLVEPLSRLVTRPLDWLWPGRLARGKLSIFDGDPEIGKSLATLDLCARLTTGRPFADGAPAVEPSNVLIVNGEDAAEDTILPRLRALDADLNRAFVLHKDLLDREGPFRLPTHTGILEEALANSRAVLAVLDPVMAFLDPSIQVVSDMSVRRVLSPLAKACQRYGCHTIMVRHLNKTGHFRSLYRGGGSIGFLAACRSGFLFARDPQDPLRSVMAQIKNNLGPRQPSLAYRIKTTESGLPVLEWLGEHPLSADQLLAAAGMKPYLPGPADRARDFLLAFLDDGPRTTIDIWDAAKEQGISRRTVQRLRNKLDIRSKDACVSGRHLTYWLLPSQDLPQDIEPTDPDIPSLEPWLAPLREQYPPNPLDDDE
jgi:hypothetical protein